jgi:hypothetical protein
MRGTVKSFRKALREAFDDALKKDESVNPDDLGMDSEEESASRERQQASGYLGAIDGPPDYGDDQSGQVTESDEDDKETVEEDVEEEGVNTSKRSAHGYALEDPTDYDVSGGETVAEGHDEDDEKDDDVEKEGMLGPGDDEENEDPLSQHLGSFRVRSTGSPKNPIDDTDDVDLDAQELMQLMGQPAGAMGHTSTPHMPSGHAKPGEMKFGGSSIGGFEPDVEKAVSMAQKSGKPVIDPKSGKADFTTSPKLMALLKHPKSGKSQMGGKSGKGSDLSKHFPNQSQAQKDAHRKNLQSRNILGPDDDDPADKTMENSKDKPLNKKQKGLFGKIAGGKKAGK